MRAPLNSARVTPRAACEPPPPLLMLLLLLLLTVALGSTAPATAAEVSSTAAPGLAVALTQPFYASVVSCEYGTFNATLRLSASANYPERLFGEFVPFGGPLGATRLPHFTDVSTDARDDSDERPPLCFVDVLLSHPAATSGTMALYFLPTDPTERSDVMQRIADEVAQPTVNFTFDFTQDTLAPSAMSDLLELAMRSTGAATVAGDTERASYTWRFYSEYEFSFHIVLSTSHHSDASECAAGAASVWVHAYTPPGQLFDRRKLRQRPWYETWAIVIASATMFLFQLFLGVTSGRQSSRAQARAAVPSRKS